MTAEEINMLADALSKNKEFANIVSKAIAGRVLQGSKDIVGTWKEDLTEAVFSARKQKEAEFVADITSWVNNHLLSQSQAWKEKVVGQIEKFIIQNTSSMVKELISESVRDIIRNKISNMNVSMRFGDLFDD